MYEYFILKNCISKFKFQIITSFVQRVHVEGAWHSIHRGHNSHIVPSRHQ